MDRGSVTSGAAFKTAFRATLLFAVVLTVASFVAYHYIRLELRNAVITQLLQDEAFLRQIYRDGGSEKLVTAIDQMNHLKVAKLRAVGLFDEQGQKLAGNIDKVPDYSGWQERRLTLAGSPTSKAVEYQLHAGPLNQLTLVIGDSLDEIRVQENRMFVAFSMMAAVLSLAFLAIGYFGSLQALRKLEQMADTLERVSKGEPATRLDISQANDQIDRVSRAMNFHLDRLSALMAATKANAAAIAHDLRTPLSRAVLAVEQAMALAETGQSPRMALASAEVELARLNTVFDAILRISRLESSEAATVAEPIAVAQLLTDLCETFAPVAEEKGQSLTIAAMGTNLTTRTDGALLAQLIANLIQNAISHCPSGTAITLAAEVRLGKLLILVRDTGPGIPDKERDRVFDLFYQVDPNRAKGGNGLGLALVKAIAERLGAQVRLTDAAPGLQVEVAMDLAPSLA
ncbi:MAG: sensor histidine kinase [Cypionkella sp.]